MREPDSSRVVAVVNPVGVESNYLTESFDLSSWEARVIHGALVKLVEANPADISGQTAAELMGIFDSASVYIERANPA